MKRFTDLLHGSDMGDTTSLSHLDRFVGNVHFYCWAERCVRSPDEVPWPIIGFLARAHTKALLLPSRLYSAKTYRVGLVNMANRLHWRYAYRDSSRPQAFILPMTRCVPPCTAGCDAVLEGWLAGSQAKLTQAIRASRSAPVKWHAPPLTPFAKRLLERRGWLAMPNDKDGGFSIAPAARLVDLETPVLSNESVYRYCGQGEHDELCRSGRTSSG